LLSHLGQHLPPRVSWHNQGRHMNKLRSCFQKIDIRHLFLVLAITETLHNTEEAIWLPSWSSTLSFWQPIVAEREFRIALILLTLLFYGAMYYSITKDTQVSNYIFSGIATMILFNVFFPHLLGTIITGELVPGVVTGTLLNIPITVLLLWKGMKEKRISWKTIMVGGIGYGLLTVPLLLVSFTVGYIIKQLAF